MEGITEYIRHDHVQEDLCSVSSIIAKHRKAQELR